MRGVLKTMDDLDHIEFEHAANSQDSDYLASLEESCGQEGGSFIGGGMSKTCRFCGESRLYWYRDSKNKWRLENEKGEPHVCRKDILDKKRKDEYHYTLRNRN